MRNAFYPPYLFKGARPIIAEVPEALGYGAEFAIGTAQANDIRWASLMRAGSTTHRSDTDQRLVAVPFSVASGNRLRAVLTGEPNLAPSGWYMLFLINQVDYGVTLSGRPMVLV